MKVIVTRNTFIDGDVVEASDKPVDLNADDARMLIRMGKAVAYTAPKTAPKPAAKQTKATKAK